MQTKRWVNACRREGFNLENVTKDTYICNLHFVGNKGPTVDHPDPIPATATDRQVYKLLRNRKLPTNRSTSAAKHRKVNIPIIDPEQLAVDGLLSLSRSVEYEPRPYSTASTMEDIIIVADRWQLEENSSFVLLQTWKMKFVN